MSGAFAGSVADAAKPRPPARATPDAEPPPS